MTLADLPPDQWPGRIVLHAKAHLVVRSASATNVSLIPQHGAPVIIPRAEAVGLEVVGTTPNKESH
jgi:hypothetical protein